MTRLLLSLAALASCLAVRAVAEPAQPIAIVSEGPYAPAGAQQLVVHSARLQRDYVVVVSAPPPGPLTAGHKLPAIYALDGGYGVAGPIAQMMAWAFMMSPAYVVSIGYPDGHAADRDTDLLHRATVRDGATIGGGGAAFEAFLESDLRPWLEARYPLDPNRAILFGHSYGGLFAANVLADAPTSFAGYVIASPSVFADPQLLARLPAAAPKGGGRRVYVAVGGGETANDMVGDAKRIGAALSAPGSTFVVQTRIFDGETHISYFPLLVPAAFGWILPLSAAPPPAQPKPIAVAPETLERLVGVYALEGGRVITVTRQGAKLFAGMTGYPGGEVLAETATRFFAPGLDVQIDFEIGPAGKASAVVAHVNGAVIRAVRKS